MTSEATRSGETVIQVGDKSYTLSFRIKALVMLQKRYFDGSSAPPDINEILKLAKAGSLDHRIGMFWASLQKYHPGVSFDEAIDLVDELGGIGWLGIMFKDLDASLAPDPEDAKELEEAAAGAASEAAAERENPSEAQADGSIGESSSSALVGSV